MILGFKEFFDAKKTQPTYFRDKIRAPYFKVYPNSTQPPVIEIYYKPKLHTFRLDPHDRWKAGMSIQMVYRGPKYSIKDHFNKGIPELERCKSTQKVEIKWYKDKSWISEAATLAGIKSKNVKISIDGKECIHVSFNEVGFSCAGVNYDRLIHGDLFQNDGFYGVYEFFKWFNNDWKGKIIHWTDLRY
jgi:hypothetical protein